MGIRRNKAEATSIDYDKLAQNTADRIRQPTTSANIWAVVGNVDGRFTTGDVFVAFLLFGALFTMGLASSIIDWATGAPWEVAKSYLKDLSRLGVGLAVGYLIFEALNVVGMAEGITRVLAEQRKNGNGNGHSVNITVPVHLERGQFKFLRWEGDEAVRAVAFARRYLELERTEDYPTAEKFYVGSGLVWSNSDVPHTGRRGWQAFKAELLASRLAYEDGTKWHLNQAGVGMMRRLVEEAEESGL